MTDDIDLDPYRLDLRSVDVVEPRAQALASLFPEAIRDGKLDVDRLAQLLGDVADDGPERFGLTWPGKADAIRMAQRPSEGTLVPMKDESADWDTTQNIVIEGENLEVLKLLQRSYHGKVKLIYIDPPYNTGKDFVYPDNFRDPLGEYLRKSRQVDGEGMRLRANAETSGRYHSSWLSMMWPRLHLARSLLREDGAIAISIDDAEMPRLRLLMDEIFGEQQFVACLAVQLNPRGRNLSKFIAQTHEYVLVYTRDIEQDSLVGVEKDERMTAEYRHADDRGRYREIELRNRNPRFNRTTRPNLFYPIYVAADGSVAAEQDDTHTIEVVPRDSDGNESCWTWSKALLADKLASVHARESPSGWRIFRRDYLYGADGQVARTLPKSLWTEPALNNDNGKKAIRELLGTVDFDFPKSPELIRKLLRMSTSENDIVLDFFAGAGTTGHAVIDENRADGCNRRFILVQLPERIDDDGALVPTISALTRSRVRAAGEMGTGDLFSESSRAGFRAYALAGSAFPRSGVDSGSEAPLFDPQPEANPSRDDEALLTEVLLARGFDLVTPTTWANVGGLNVASVADGALVACFTRDIAVEQFEALVARDPAQLILLEAAFGGNDEVKVNAIQHLRTVNAHRDTPIELLLL